MKHFRCFLLMRFPPATLRSENFRLLIAGSGFCMISPALCCGLLERTRQSLRFQPPVELFDPVIAGCALLAHTPTMMAVFIDVKFGFVSRSFEGIVESDDLGAGRTIRSQKSARFPDSVANCITSNRAFQGSGTAPAEPSGWKSKIKSLLGS
jgi:hypothetical protein